MVITFEDAQEYLEGQGISIPAVMLRAIIARINALEPCFIGAGYDEGTQLLIGLYLVGLLGLVSADGRVRSQSAPSGASRSFFFASMDERYRSYLGQIQGLDPSGCSTSIIPPNPTASNCALFISPGACFE